MSIAEKQEQFISDYNELGDWFMQYEYLIAQTLPMEPLPASEKIEKNRITGCQSNIWLAFTRDGDRLLMRGDSDSLIIKGILGVILRFFNGERISDILAAPIYFLEKTSLHTQLTSEKTIGFNSVIETIKKNCL